MNQREMLNVYALQASDPVPDNRTYLPHEKRALANMIDMARRDRICEAQCVEEMTEYILPRKKLIHPIIIDNCNNIVYGFILWKAAIFAGFNEVPVHVVQDQSMGHIHGLLWTWVGSPSPFYVAEMREGW